MISFKYWKFLHSKNLLHLRNNKSIAANFNTSTRSDYWAKILAHKLTKEQLQELVVAIETLKANYHL